MIIERPYGFEPVDVQDLEQGDVFEHKGQVYIRCEPCEDRDGNLIIGIGIGTDKYWAFVDDGSEMVIPHPNARLVLG